MFDKFFYFATTFAEGCLAVFGMNGAFEQPAYHVRELAPPGLEIRDYGPLAAAETTVTGNPDAAFRLLFAYISGGNDGARMIAMTAPVQQAPVQQAPVQQAPAMIAMTTPVRQDIAASGATTMRFFLPARLAANPPKPLDPRVRITTTPPATVAVLRYSGNPTPDQRDEKQRALFSRLATTAWKPAGTPYFLSYDPPFTIPFLKRNEVAIAVTANSR